LDIRIPDTLDAWNAAGADYLPGLLGVRFSKVEGDEVVATLEVRRALAASNGYLHAGTVTSLADACCGYGAVRGLPAGANGFTTLELKSNLIGTAREGIVVCTAHPIHKGRTTQVWDAQVRRESDGAPIAYFRNTQLILWPKV
jgi:1,4-dihydroxy-2-naphthoyl-CoA hydrolase